MIGYALAFIAGWLCCGAVHRVLHHIAIRVLTTAVGKKKLADAMAKTANLQPHSGEGVISRP